MVSLFRHAPEPATVHSTAEPVTLAVVGCGQRGKAYAKYALSDPAQCAVVAIAEPRPRSRAAAAAAHAVDATLVFDDWKALLAASAETIATIGRRLADAVVIAVQDHLHADVVLAFAAQGYHILCEKPLATTVADCLRIEAAVAAAGIIFATGHVLRYSPYTRAITDIVRGGTLGELVNAVHVEPVGYFHFAHSYVRGNWAREDTSSFVLMTKSCHDIDLLCHWFAPATLSRVSSFGSLRHFRRDAKPATAAAATRCLDCAAEPTCPYSAKKIYLTPVARGITGWPASTLVDGPPDLENIADALARGPYGRCVYEADNDVCDNQVAALEFTGGRTASFTLAAHTARVCERQTRLHFTHGELVGDMTSFTVTDFRTGQTRTHRPPDDGGGHGGGDRGLIAAFVDAVRSGKQEVLGTDVHDIVRSHLAVFAAEMSRREGRVVDCAEFERKARAAHALV